MEADLRRLNAVEESLMAGGAEGCGPTQDRHAVVRLLETEGGAKAAGVLGGRLEPQLLLEKKKPRKRFVGDLPPLTVVREGGRGAWREVLVPGQALTMLEIPAGAFQMGAPPDEPERFKDEGPQRPVQMERFFLAQTPITQAQWRAVALWQQREGEIWGRELNPDPSRFQGSGVLLGKGEENTDDRPVEQVSWFDAMEFCSRLSQRTGRIYTLPSEAQWEYACRAGTTTPFHYGPTITPDLANYDARQPYGDVPKGEFRQQTTPVGSFPANAWGLHDMHGNVWEWCLDHWHDTFEGAPRDGSAWLDPEEGEDASRLVHGGSWASIPTLCRSAFRILDDPGRVDDDLGFRVVCLLQTQTSPPATTLPA